MASGIMRRQTAASLFLLLASAALSALLFEITVRQFIPPSRMSYGTLLGRELPPVKVIPPRALAPTSGPSAQHDNVATITRADLQGVFREDPLLGYAPQENATSPNGWWHANNIGARSTIDTPPGTPHGKQRILVFGESFAGGSRLRQDDGWAAVLAAADASLEVVNLAVDGYGMGQSFLRFRTVRQQIDYDVAMLVFVPTVDLWRDINTIRSLAKPSWNSYTVMPRFVLEGGQLVLVRSPYAIGSDVYADNPHGLSDTLKHHLQTYDRFYFRTQYESPPLIGDLVLYKIAATVYHSLAMALLNRTIGKGRLDLDSEAMQVSRGIFAAMRDEVESSTKRFVLVILPEKSALRRIRKSSAYSTAWRNMVTASCDGQCIDLTPTLLDVPSAQFDSGQDGSHYGPRMQRIIAAAVADGLRRSPER